MATYYSNKIVFNALGQNTIEPKYREAGSVDNLAIVSLPTGTQLNAGDTLQLMDVSELVTVTGALLDVDKLDGSGTPTLVLSIGDSLNAARFFSHVSTAEAGGYATPNINGAIGTNYGTLDGITSNGFARVFATVVTGAAAAMSAAGALRFVLTFTADP